MWFMVAFIVYIVGHILNDDIFPPSQRETNLGNGVGALKFTLAIPIFSMTKNNEWNYCSPHLPGAIIIKMLIPHALLEVLCSANGSLGPNRLKRDGEKIWRELCDGDIANRMEADDNRALADKTRVRRPVLTRLSLSSAMFIYRRSCDH